MNEIARNVMKETIRQAGELSRIVEGVPHCGLRGQLRESFLARALSPWLPRAFELGTGVIIDYDNSKREVNQDDVIIYAPDLLPPILPLLDQNIFLIDAVIAHIEVKSTLTSTTLDEALDSAISVDNLKTKYDGKRSVCLMHGEIEGMPGVRRWYDLEPKTPQDSMLAFISTLASMVSEQRRSRKFVEIFRFVSNPSACIPI